MFDVVYHSVVADIFRFWTREMQEEIAAHNVGWSPEVYDFENYLHASVRRYRRAYRALSPRPGLRVCDVGGFWGAFTVTLARLGLDVTSTERRSFYGSAFDELFQFIQSEGVRTIDCDLLGEEIQELPVHDAVTALAVVEHYPHSLAQMMGNVRRLLGKKNRGVFLLEVPNIAYWPQRMALLRGRSPLPGIDIIYRSKVPFTGHHHEFTGEEIEHLAKLGGFDVVSIDWFNYSETAKWWTAWRYHPIQQAIYRAAPRTREVALAKLRPRR